MIPVQSKQNREKFRQGGEIHDCKDTIVESAGYIPPKIQIFRLIEAGEKLKAARAEQFDFPDHVIDPNFEDPTRKPGFDMAEGTTIQKELVIKFKQQQNEKNEEIKEEENNVENNRLPENSSKVAVESDS